MAGIRAKIPVGSAPWIVSERRQASELVEQDVEEFGYSVRNEMEWLNEHMGEIFAANQLNVTDMFKTPGKLRGKTPRTARKQNAVGNRAPLTDIFAPNSQTGPSPTKTQLYKSLAQIQVAEDNTNKENSPAPSAGPSTYKDSGYHGMTDDEAEITGARKPLGFYSSPKKAPEQQAPVVVQPEFNVPVPPAEQRRVTEDSFVSAKESLASRNMSQEDLNKEKEASTQNAEAVGVIEQAASALRLLEQHAESVAEGVEQVQPNEAVEEPEAVLDRMDEEEVHSPSEGSSPVKPLLRKSSLTFASLPAREPLANKKSIGARPSHVDQYKAGRSSQLGRFTGGKSLGGQQHLAASTTRDEGDAMDIDAVEQPTLERQESETTKMHHQTTTQRLHDRINMLGQSRSSKSNLFGSSAAQPMYPQLPQAQPENDPVRPAGRPQADNLRAIDQVQEDDDDDWIAPVTTPPAQNKSARPLLLKTRTVDQLPGNAKPKDPEQTATADQGSPKHRLSPSRLPFGHKKVVSASAIASPTRLAMAPDAHYQKAISVSNPPVQYTGSTTTPAGSPKRGMDGPLSATKAKLYSALRSAKGIFASSAGVSAQAKMEALSPGPRSKQQRQPQHFFSPTEEYFPAPALYPNLGDSSRITSAESAASNSTDGRRTRSSSEREQKKKDEEVKQQRKIAGNLDKLREKERHKATAAANMLQKSPSKDRVNAIHRQAAPSRTESERSKETEADSGDEMPPPPPPKSMLPTTQSQRLREPRRIAKPVSTKEAQSKMRPAPVTVRMPSQRIGQHLPQPSTAALSESLNESLPPPVPPKPTLVSKASTSSLHGSSSTTSLNKSSGSSQAAKKTLEAAAKKREQDVKAAQRKAEQKREMERRRAAKLDEERRRQEDERRRLDEERRREEDERRAEQQRKATDQQRREEVKRTAQKQATDAKRAEQQRKDAHRPQQNDFAHAMQQEKGLGPYGRADLGNARSMSRLNLVQDPQRPAMQINPAKPPKRALPVDDEQPSRPAAHRNPPSYQQLEVKRRKTNDRDDEDEITQPQPRVSVMAPPVRHSNIRKDNNKFAHGYAPAPPATQHAASMFVKTVTGQHIMQHGKPGHPNDMAKYANARIPFAEAPNPPAGPSAQHKTPGRPMPNSSAAMSAQKAVKSSPYYPNGENIALPEIATDSEDEDSENEFQAPSWTDSPALREALTNQQLVDPEQIFGPIAPLKMEEIFKNKERHKKFRDRTSSANWNGADRLTEEERIKDREARERLMQQGGWTFQPGS